MVQHTHTHFYYRSGQRGSRCQFMLSDCIGLKMETCMYIYIYIYIPTEKTARPRRAAGFLCGDVSQALLAAFSSLSILCMYVCIYTYVYIYIYIAHTYIYIYIYIWWANSQMLNVCVTKRARTCRFAVLNRMPTVVSPMIIIIIISMPPHQSLSLSLYIYIYIHIERERCVHVGASGTFEYNQTQSSTDEGNVFSYFGLAIVQSQSTEAILLLLFIIAFYMLILINSSPFYYCLLSIYYLSLLFPPD